jgi:hypothetical protein
MLAGNSCTLINDRCLIVSALFSWPVQLTPKFASSQRRNLRDSLRRVYAAVTICENSQGNQNAPAVRRSEKRRYSAGIDFASKSSDGWRDELPD